MAEAFIDIKTTVPKTNIPMKPEDFVSTASAVQAAIQLAQATWLEYISGVEVNYSGGSFKMSRQSGTYQQAVMTGLKYPFQNNPLSGMITVNLNYVDILERGFTAFEMKDAILKGRPYVNVPFEHVMSATPTVIKSNIDASGRLMSKRIAGGLRTTQIGQRSKLTPGELGMRPYTWRTGLYTGLKVQKGGQAMTFRRISANSPDNAWIHPGVDAMPVTKALEENLRRPIEKMIMAGLDADIKRANI